MDIMSFIESSGGIAHRADLIEAGASRYGIDRLVAGGEVRPVRRRWLALPSCPEALLTAALLGGRVSCLTAAESHQLWCLPDGRIHLSVSANASCRAPSGVRLHWGALPRPVGPRSLLEPVDNLLVHLAECQPLESAVVVFDAALRTRKTTLAHLRRLPVRSSRYWAALDRANALADSGIETLPRMRLERLGIMLRQQVTIDGHDVDGLVGDRLVLQFDGFGPHSTSVQRDRDLRQDARLAVLGYTVLRFSYRQVAQQWPDVEQTILTAMAQRLHLAARHDSRRSA